MHDYRRELTIDEARALAERIDRRQEQRDAKYEELTDPDAWDNRVARAVAQFQHLSAGEIVKHWESRTNAAGQPLSKVELAALIEIWCAIFGNLPPADGAGAKLTTAQPSQHEPLPEDNDTMTRAAVAKKLSASISTILRLERDGRLPKPLRSGPRSRRHLVKDVNAQIQRLGDERAMRASWR
jgi:predicted DNA-binding transcriptional regulator AlpA